MEDIFAPIADFFKTQQFSNFVRAAIIVVGGFILARLVSSLLYRAAKNSLDRHRLMLLRRGAYYLLLIVTLLWALGELGFDMGVLLGTAGIVTVALAFASQTSMSNFISGLFLVAERPFEVGDLIQVGSITGEVLEIGTMSVKLRTFDNTYVRLPNETLIKTEFMTLTRFPIRRLDLQFGVAYHEDIGQVEQILFQVADNNPLSLEEPRPLFIFQGFGESALKIQFSVWVLRENYLTLKNSIQEEIKRAFDAAEIEIPYPHRTLYTGTITQPFPVKIVDAGHGVGDG